MVDFFLDSMDIELLQRAIDARCKHLNIPPESAEAQMIASQLIELFQHGVTDEEQLAAHPIAVELFRRKA